MLLWLLFVLLLPVAVAVLYFACFLLFLRWHFHQIKGDRFFALPLAQRQQFERSLVKYSRLLMPFVKLLSKVAYSSRLPTFRYKNIACTSAIASADTFARAENYPATADDIFIATQMKCGTTWMQQIVFEILHHGEGDLGDNGYRHIYALSPWIETSPNASVPMENAPKVSRYKKRIIKTHLPAQLCPYSATAKYIYVARNPVSCFASCKDFLEFLAGPLCPRVNDLADWFCSDDMWWGTWADHVAGWWDKSLLAGNIFFITFEEMKDDTRGVIERLCHFLDVELSAAELDTVVEKASFRYMQQHEEQFEMSPPNLFSVATSELRFMQSGSKQRSAGIPADIQQHIVEFSRARLVNRQFPFTEIYRDIL